MANKNFSDTALRPAGRAARQSGASEMKRKVLVSAVILALGVGAGPAMAGCNSGDTANTDPLSSANCQATASGNESTAVGAGAQATGMLTSAFGEFSQASGLGSSAFGVDANASGDYTTAVGTGVTATASGSVAYGLSSAATGIDSIASGYYSTAAGDYSSAFGALSWANAANSIAIGGNGFGGNNRSAYVDAAATNGIAIGNQSYVGPSGINALAVGFGAQANGANAIAIGANSVSAANSTVVGPGATDNGFTNASVYGVNAQVGAAGNVAIGDTANAAGATSVAIGQNSTASGSGSTAIGQGAQATAANSVALGSGSITTAPNTVSVGAPGAERRLTNVAPAVNGTDAVNLDQLTAATSGMGADGLTQANTYTDQQVAALRKDAFIGIAQAAALVPMAPSSSGETTLNVGVASYGGYSAAGLAVAHQIGSRTNLNAGVGLADGGRTLARVGLGFRF